MKKYGEWKIMQYSKEDCIRLTKAGFSPLVSALLCSRGIVAPDYAKEMLRDDIDLLADPFLMADMDKAVKRIKTAIKNGERVAVYGDYDVDGITSTCLITDYLRKKGLYCEAYIPERLTEGYGISDDALLSLKNNDITLIITVDCGITASAQVELAGRLGIDVVITDHHECLDEIPNAVAVIDPHRKDCFYPFKGLAGVGVAFKLVCALEGVDRTAEILDEYGDLAAIGTIADIMPVKNENRTIIRHGIEVLSMGKRLGLRKLMEETCPPNKTISSGDVSFTVVPKLNAAGRMGNVRIAYKLLMTKDETKAAGLVEDLCLLNSERRQVESKIYNEASEIVESIGVCDSPIVLASEDWHHGVSGIVASRLSDRYGVPAVIICIEGDEGRGSCRSFGCFNIFDALDSSKDILLSFGGHAFAAGLTLKKENIDQFRDSFCRFFKQNKGVCSKPALKIDFEVPDIGMLSLGEIEALSRLSPWGNGNPPPMLCVTDTRIDSVIPIGCDKHLKLKISKDRHTIECVFFSMTADEFGLKAGSCADFAFEPVINEFRGNRSAQLILRDARQSQRRVLRERRLCDSFFAGKELTISERLHILPRRDDFIALWRYLSSIPDIISGDKHILISEIAMRAHIGNTGKTYIGLRVLDELDLISFLETDGTIEIHIPEATKKVDLNSSKLISELKG
ncbi:MAG: single-stranded-DNA-specific exonuclease RecJ [Clostridiales bacterium]|nr:single-stranded-DNA-specific exonuclease RecJ [Clostridiales bacterium]